MKKLLRFIGAIVILAGAFIGISVLNMLKEEDNGYQLTEEAIAEAVADMGDDIYAGEMYLDGVRYEMPIAVQDLAKAGWQLSDSFQLSESTIPANTAYVNNIILSNDAANNGKGASLQVSLINLTSEEVKLEESHIYEISFSTLTGNKMILPKGITLASTLEEVEAAYGEPTEKKVYDLNPIQRTILEYSIEGIRVFFTFEAEENEAPKMTDFGYSFDI